MADFLYKLGSLAARKAWAVIAIWVVVLAALGGSYAAFHGKMSDEISIPGTEAMQVQEQLQDVFDMNTNAANSSVILQTEGGGDFTQEQKDALATVLEEVNGVEGVNSTTNPFATQDQINQGFAQLEEGQAQIDEQAPQLEAGATQLAEAQQELDNNAAQVEEQQGQLDAQRAELEEAGAPAEAFAQLDEAQAQIDEARTQLTGGQAQIDEQRTQLEDGQRQLEQGQAEIDQNRALLELTADGASMISDDGSTAIASVIFDQEVGSVPESTLDDTRSVFEKLEDSGIAVNFDQNMQSVAPHMSVTAEIIGIIVAFIILVVMLGSLVAAGLPIVMAIIGVAAAAMGTLALSGIIDMSSTTLALGTMLGLAVGIDYTLFILNRHRSNLAQGMEMKHSIAMAVGTSGSAVAFAGITVMIALIALNVVGIPFLGVMGNAAAFSVFMAVAVALTLAPACLSLIGRRVMSKKRWDELQKRNLTRTQASPEELKESKAAAAAHEEKESGWLKAILAKPLITVLASVAALALLAIPVTSMRLGLPTAAAESPESAANKTYHLISDNFGEGRNGMIIAAADLPEGTTAEQAQALQVEIGQELSQQNHVDGVVPALIAEDNSMLLYQLTPAEGPNAESTEELVHSLRGMNYAAENGDVTFGVTGQTAMAIDIAQNLQDVLPTYIGIVMGLSFIVLVLAFRSLLVPLTASIGFLFSLMAALGVTTAVFQWGWLGSLFGVHQPAPLLAFLPILAVGILFGLAMDYQMFLVSGMREAYAHGRGAKKSVVIGYNHNAKVVVAAALIMAGVFLGFVFSGDPMISSIGFVLAAGVLFDAFVVRLTLIPALMKLMGEKAWWFPKWMDRLIPDLDVEGTKLEEKFANNPDTQAIPTVGKPGVAAYAAGTAGALATSTTSFAHEKQPEASRLLTVAESAEAAALAARDAAEAARQAAVEARDAAIAARDAATGKNPS